MLIGQVTDEICLPGNSQAGDYRTQFLSNPENTIIFIKALVIRENWSKSLISGLQIASSPFYSQVQKVHSPNPFKRRSGMV